ncbi:MAG: imidazole glycerol phosphate synthase subunit HisH [Calditrichaeota bacterium]|nr:MAG: imidazole glycerol phosphate synthase subunit HisH [Calditrichota bacterium]
MINIIDYEGGNLFSVVKAFEFLGAEPKVITRPEEYEAGKIVIPGVGDFGDAMRALQERNFPLFLHEKAQEGVLLIGICVGVQILFQSSEEAPDTKGLSFFRNAVKRFSPGGKIPHMGWNTLDFHSENPLLYNVENGSYVYFAHSYYIPVASNDYEIAHCHYSDSFTAVVNRDNIYGVQFHPEKSQKTGLQILKNFIEL